MNNLTDRQKAAIYDDAVEELRFRLDAAKEDAKEAESDLARDYSNGSANAFRIALELLTKNEWVEYVNAPTRWELATRFYAYIGVITTLVGGIWVFIKLVNYIF